MLGFKLNIVNPSRDYNLVICGLNLESLTDRRLNHDLFFLHYFISGKIV